jgi:hypothetical protein
MRAVLPRFSRVYVVFLEVRFSRFLPFKAIAMHAHPSHNPNPSRSSPLPAGCQAVAILWVIVYLTPLFWVDTVRLGGIRGHRLTFARYLSSILVPMVKTKPPPYQTLIERSITARGFGTEKYYVIDSRTNARIVKCRNQQESEKIAAGLNAAAKSRWVKLLSDWSAFASPLNANHPTGKIIVFVSLDQALAIYGLYS